MATERVVVPHGRLRYASEAFPLHAAPDRPEERPGDPEESRRGGFDARRYLELALNGAVSCERKRVRFCEQGPPREAVDPPALR